MSMPKSPTSQRAVGFIRGTSDVSSEEQRERLERFCSTNHIGLVHVVTREDRPFTTRMGEAIAACLEHRARKILVIRRRLITDDLSSLALIEQYARSLGLEIESLGGEPPVSDEAAAFVERVQKVVRSRGVGGTKREQRVAWSARTAPYGYRVRSAKDLRLVREPSEMRVVKLVVKLRAKGWSYQGIADECTRLGHVNRKGGRFYISQIVQILKRFAPNGEGTPRGSGLGHYVNSAGDPENSSAASGAPSAVSASIASVTPITGEDPTTKRAA
jgi:recombinase